ncbi:fimbrial biogenesis chaperone [Vibrio fluminensis]|uniref:fimbrial biogenesis chaperone n=1 Tax=Vibrio fluminensis TaxID=2783614 RepID=UPI001886B2CE|nr:fimbria/pilus periplasmic chaperone [Vibrio fluminensis]
MRISVIALILMVFNFSLLNLAYANFNISPLSQSIDVKKKSASFTLENMTNQKAAYEVQAYARNLDSDGEEVRTKTKEIRVFPSKIILEPKQKKRIKVLYLGKKSIGKEKAYRIVFMQTDRNVSEDDPQGLNAKFNFHTAFYVTPKDAQARLTSNLEQYGKNTYLSLSNTGSKHAILQDWQLKLSSGAQSAVYESPLPDVNMLADTQIRIPLSQQAHKYQTAEIITK